MNTNLKKGIIICNTNLVINDVFSASTFPLWIKTEQRKFRSKGTSSLKKPSVFDVCKKTWSGFMRSKL